MSSLGPRLNTQILGGEGDVTKFDNTYAFTVNEKVERIIKLNDSSEVIDLSDLSNPSIFVFKGSNDFDLTITLLDANTITFPVTDTFSMVIDPVFAATISSLSVAASAATVDISVSVRIYSEV